MAGACFGVYLFYRGFGLLKRKRLIEDTPTSKIRSASLGLVEVSGLAAGPRTMLAPITGRACYYYHTTAWKLKQSGRSSQWEKVADESVHLPFFLDDNTGKVLVDPTSAEMDIHRDFHEEYSSSLLSFNAKLPPSVEGFLARHGVSDGKRFKVEEYCIKPKNFLFVLGTLAENSAVLEPLASDPAAPHPPSADPPAIRPAGRNLTSTSTAKPDSQTVAAALMRAGINNPAAWAVAGVEPAEIPVGSFASSASTAAAAAVALEPFDPHPPVVLRKGEHSPAFFISWRSQRDVVESLGWKSAAMIWGGPALTLFSVYVVLLHFGLL
jgi:hypothetical protein